MAAFTKAVAAAESYAELETIVQDAIGPTGLMEFTRFSRARASALRGAKP
jgi:hypothetical protein